MLRMVTDPRERVTRNLLRGLHALAWLIWAYVTLDQFGLLDPARAAVLAALSAELAFGTLTLSLGNLLAFGVTVAAAFWLSRLLRFVLETDLYPRVPLARGVPYAISSLLHYALLLGGFFLAISALGVDLTRFTILAGAFGVGLGFGLQNVVNNFVSGLIMLFERPMNVGDTVQIENLTGQVQRIGMRSSTLLTMEGAEVIVPNATLIAERLTNWTLSNRRRRVDVRIGVAYGTDPQRMLELLVAVARGHRAVLAYPPPLALFLAFGESSLDFELRVWTNEFEEWQVTRSEISLALLRALGEAGIEVPFPQRVVHVQPGSRT
jgi:small-conductance mechanosensitive channel